jgi:predicted transcriptional regulator
MQKTEIRVEPIDAFWNRGRKNAALADAGARIPHSRVVAFQDVEDLLSVLTKQRVLLLKTLKETPGSIAELARRLKRDRSSVTRDVQLLERHGVVEVSEKPLAGHGRQKWVASIGQEIQLIAHL